MRVGVIARAEDRGLGILTADLVANLAGHVDLSVAVVGITVAGFPSHLDRYPGATVLDFDGHRFQEAQVRRWLAGLDVVYSAETFYDWRVCTWAREAGARTVLHVMPEFYRHGTEDHPAPDAWWIPTGWRAEHLPPAALVPVPVDPRPDLEPTNFDRPLRVLHVAGHRAGADRNGTLVFAQALRHVTEPIVATVCTQDDRLPVLTGIPGLVELRLETGGRRDRWRLYRGQDVMVLPRRYGGLSLPVNEAMASGLAVILPNVDPHVTAWPPALLMPCRSAREYPVPAGIIRLTDTDPRAIARHLDHLALERWRLVDAQAAARAWSIDQSWDRLRPLYLEQLARVAAG